MKETLIIIGNNIRTARRKKNIKQEDLANMADVQKGAISKIENGEVINLTIVRLGKIAKALKIKIETLFIEPIKVASEK